MSSANIGGMTLCKWRSKTRPGYRCLVPAEPGSDFCLFHQPLDNKDPEEFVNRLQDQITGSSSRADHNPSFSFVGYKFPCSLIQESVGLNITAVRLPQLIPDVLDMAEAVVAGQLILNDIEFGKAACLEEAEIHGKCKLVHTTFSAGLQISDARFREQLVCRGSSFHTGKYPVHDKDQESSMLAIGTEFSNGAEFLDCTFDQNVVLTRSRAGHDMYFNHSKFMYSIYIKDAQWQGNGSFGHVNAQRIDLNGARIRGSLLLVHATVGFLELQNLTIGRMLSLPDLIITKVVNARGSSARQAYVGERRPTILRLVRNRRGFESRARFDNSSIWMLLAKAFAADGDRHKADASHYFARDALLREAIRRSSWFGKCVGIVRYAGDLLFMRLPTAYGASLTRLFATWVALIGIFTVTYFLLYRAGMQVFSPGSVGLEVPFSFGRALYFSIVTFTTLGYGDIVPGAGLGSALVATEAILGGIMMALTVMVVGRKFMR